MPFLFALRRDQITSGGPAIQQLSRSRDSGAPFPKIIRCTQKTFRQLALTPAFASAQRQRKTVEALFAELKNQIGLRRLRLRRLKFVREQFFLAAAAQNIKRLVRFLSQPITPPLPGTA